MLGGVMFNNLSQDEIVRRFIDSQEKTINFFMNTSKPVISIDYSIYRYYESDLKGYPKLERRGMNGEVEDIILAKEQGSLDLYKRAFEIGTEEKLKILGKLYGYPESAIGYFVNENVQGDRHVVNYYGLSFVCSRRGLDKVKEELEEMYGLEFESEHVSIQDF